MTKDFGSFRLPKKSVRSRNTLVAKQTTDCPYCPNKIRPGMAIMKDYDALEFAHLGCFRRVQAAVKIAMSEEENELA